MKKVNIIYSNILDLKEIILNENNSVNVIVGGKQLKGNVKITENEKHLIYSFDLMFGNKSKKVERVYDRVSFFDVRGENYSYDEVINDFYEMMIEDVKHNLRNNFN